MNYEELTKLNELVLHKGLVPSFEEIINQLEKQKEVLEDIKNIIKEILERFDKIPDKELLTNRCVDIEVIEEINNKIGVII